MSASPGQLVPFADAGGLVDQLQVVIELWRQVKGLISSGNYEDERLSAAGYCTNVIDVRLLDAIDTLHTLDEETHETNPNYHPIFHIPDSNRPAEPSIELVVYLMNRATVYYDWLRSTDSTLYDRVFHSSFADYQ